MIRLLIILAIYSLLMRMYWRVTLASRKDQPVKPLGCGVFDHIADTTASTGRRPW